MKRRTGRLEWAAAAALAAMLFLAAAAHAQEAIVVNAGCEAMTREETLRLAADAAEAFYQDAALREALASEIVLTTEVIPMESFPEEERTFYVLTHGGRSMRFFMEIIGEPDGKGRYPVYIALHGGGGGPAEINNDGWIHMAEYYRDAVESGIYIACRGITDTWDLHFREDAYPLYDRLIEAMTVLYDADPDRVYLLGFSAGGDGVYQIAPRLADRFAAVNMSSGHPNGVKLINLANCPICLQSGIRDWYSEDAMRCVRTAEFEKTLTDYRAQAGFGYEHRVFIHVPAGHNFIDCADYQSLVLKDPAAFADLAAAQDALGMFLDDLESCGLGSDVATLSYFVWKDDGAFDDAITRTVTEEMGLETEKANTSAVRYVSGFTRDPAPAKIVWDLSTRAQAREKNSFYWLEADPGVNQGIITAAYDAAANEITVETDGNVNGDFAILFHPALVDVSRPVTIRAGETVRTVLVNPSAGILSASMREYGDPGLGCVGKILYSAIVGTEQ